MNYLNCYVRPIVWRGSAQMGLSTSNADIHVAIAVWDDWAVWPKHINELNASDIYTLRRIAGRDRQKKWGDK